MKKLMLFLGCLFLFQSLQAQDQMDVFSRIAEHNPKVRAAYQQYLMRLESVNQVGPLDPELTAGYFITPMMMPDGEQRAMLSLMQMFPWFGTLQTDRSLRDKEAERMYWLFIQAINEVFFEMKKMMIDYALYQRESDFYDSLIKVNYDEEKLLQAALASGEGTLEAIIRLHQERDANEQRLLELGHSKASIEERLLLLANEEGGGLGMDQSISALEIDQWVFDAPDSHPLWQSFLSQDEALDYKVELAEKMGRPMWGLGMAYTIVGPLQSMPEASPGNLVQPMVSLSLPIYRKKYRAAVDKALLEKQELEAQKAETLNRWNMQRSSLRASWQSSIDRSELVLRQLVQLYDLEKLALSAQRNGEEDLLNLLQLQKERLRLHFKLDQEEFLRAQLSNELRFLGGFDLGTRLPETFEIDISQKD